jgi:signal transduction histidine kinase
VKLHLRSLQARIVFFHLLAIAVAALLVPLANYLVINQSANVFEARTLGDHAATIRQYLRATPSGWRLDLPEDLHTLYAHGLDGLSYAVVTAEGRPLFSSGPAGAASTSRITTGLTRFSRDGAVFYGMALPSGDGANRVWVKVAQNLQHPDVIFDDIDADYLNHVGWFTVAILALLLTIDILVIRGALAPVLRSSEIASAIDPSRTDLRLSDRNVPEELLPLIVAMNQALDRLEKGIQIQREFTADAAHELRTPLAVLRARVETMPDQDAMAALKADILVMSHVVTQLLEMAEVEGMAANAGGKADLRAICADVAGMLAAMAIAQGKSIALLGRETEVPVRGDATMIFRAVRNLVDNAIKYTAPGTTVELDVSADGRVAVMDRGPGVPEKDRDLIFRRFWRAHRNPAEGTGLGLAIVARIAERQSGKVTLSDRPQGGTVFTLQFQLAQ